MKLKAKLVLLLITAVASTALVASAQTPSPTPYVTTPYVTTPYVTTADVAGNPPALPPQPPAPPGTPVGLTPADAFAPRPVPRYGAGGRSPYFTFSPDDGGLSRQAEALAQQLAAARSDSDRDKIKSQLTDLLEKQFDQRQKRHEEEIKQLEAQIKKLKDLVDKRQENRREIIRARLDQIVKESQGLGW